MSPTARASRASSCEGPPDPDTSGSHQATPSPHALATTPRGRVVLAHIALLNLDSARYAEGLELCEIGLRYEPHNR